MIPNDRQVVGKYVRDNNEYSLDLTIPSFLSLELLLPFDGFSRRRTGTLTLTEVGKVEFMALARKMVKIMQSKDIFYDDPDEGLSVYKNIDENGISRFQVSGKVGKEFIALHPDVFIEEDNNIRTEGIRITLARTNASIVVTYTDMLILLEVLKDTSISTLSQLLFMSFKDEIISPIRSNEEKKDAIQTHSRLDELLSRTEGKLEEYGHVKAVQKND